MIGGDHSNHEAIELYSGCTMRLVSFASLFFAILPDYQGCSPGRMSSDSRLLFERDENVSTAETKNSLVGEVWGIKQISDVNYPPDAAYARFHRTRPWFSGSSGTTSSVQSSLTYRHHGQREQDI